MGAVGCQLLAVGYFTGNTGSFVGHLTSQLLTAIFMLADAVGRESIGGDNVSTCVNILLMDASNDLRGCQAEHIIVACQRYWPLGKASTVVNISRQSQ